MDRNDSDDPTRALDGFVESLRATVLPQDPTSVLDRWSFDARSQTDAPAAASPTFDHGPRAAAGRVWARGVTLDVTDVEIVHMPGAPAATVDTDWQPSPLPFETPRDASNDWQPSRVAGLAAHVPGVVAQWKPGVWVGAVRRVCGPLAEVTQTEHGPVVETLPPHILLALWPPQTLSAPFLGRWPLHAALHAVESDQVAALLVAQLPPGGEVWIAPQTFDLDVDWVLLADLVLHHDAGLRDFQVRELRAFAQAQRDAGYAHLNAAYDWPAPGRPVTRR